MVMHTQLPIHQTGSKLLGLATTIQVQMHRGYRRTVGDKIISHCADMLDLMALANATKGAQRMDNLRALLAHQRAATTWLRVALDLNKVAPGPWGEAIQLLDSVGKQANGWLSKTRDMAPAA